MNTRVKSTAIIMALIVTLSVFTSFAAMTAVAADTTTQTAKAATTIPTTEATTAAATAAAAAPPTIVAAATTTTTITASNTNPPVGQPVIFTVTLKESSTGLGLSKPVKIWHTLNGVIWQDGTHTTTNGVYAFTQAFGSTGQRVYHAEFAGDISYGTSLGTVTVNVQPSSTTATTTTITASNTNPVIGQTVTFTVTLKSEGTLLNKPVKIWHTTNGVTWQDGTQTTTNGVYSFTQAFGSAGQRVYHAEFVGDSQYGASSGTSKTVNVGIIPTTTTTTISADIKNPAVGQTVAFTVNLNSEGTLLNKPVTLWYTLNGVRTDMGPQTTTNGVYKFTQAFGSTGQVVYHAEFVGDSQYGASSGTVTVNVGIIPPTTTTTIDASPKDPAVGQTVAFTVTLKSGSALLDKPVKIWHTEPNGAQVEDGTHTTTNGVYAFTQTFGSTGQRVYHAEFAGDSQYGASLGTVTVNVGTIPTTTTISASETKPTVGQSVSFTVNLNSGGTGLSKPVKIWHTYPNPAGGAALVGQDGTYNTVNGVYTFTQVFGTTGQRVYHAEFAGDSTYAKSSNTVTVNVQPIPTSMTITASKKTPAIGETVTFTVNLKAGTSGLSKPVTIWHTTNGVRWEDGTHATVDGVYSFTQAFGSTGQRIYHVEFLGDSQYAGSSNTVTVNV